MAILPSTGLTVSAVRTALQASSTDVGTLCKSPNINKWSKYKPVPFNSVAPSDLERIRGFNNKCGLDFLETEILSTIKNEFTGKVPKWLYVPPKGGSSEPFRLGDFRGYCDAPTDMFSRIEVPSNSYVGDIIEVKLFSQNSDSNSLKISDVPYFNNKYFGVLIYKGDKWINFLTPLQYVTDDSNKNIIKIDTRKIDDYDGYTGEHYKTYTLYPVICKNGNTSNYERPPDPGIMIPIPVASKTFRNTIEGFLPLELTLEGSIRQEHGVYYASMRLTARHVNTDNITNFFIAMGNDYDINYREYKRSYPDFESIMGTTTIYEMTDYIVDSPTMYVGVSFKYNRGTTPYTESEYIHP